MKTYEVLFVTPHGNGWAIVNSDTVDSVRSILENQSRFQPLDILHIKERKVICGLNTSIIYEGHCETLMSPYDVAVSQGYDGSIEDWLESIRGESAYEVAVRNGYIGTEQQWLAETQNIQPNWNEADTSSFAYIKNKPFIPTVNNATLTIQKNGTTVDTFTANASIDKTINITVPVSASDVDALPSSTKYGAALSLSINSSTYVVTAQLKDQDGNNLGTAQTIDLPLESVVVSGSYDSTNKKIVLTLQNGNTIDVPVGDLISGLQSEITAQNPLSADLLTDGTTNVVYTATEQSKLESIEAGAEVNVQSDWNQTDTDADDYIKNKPTIPTAQIQTDWEQTDNTSKDFLKNMPDAFRNRPVVSAIDGTIIQRIVQDYDGNWYDGVVMNNKIWLKQNLKTTHYTDGTEIALGGSSYSEETPYRYYPNGNADNVDDYGYIYNWPAVMNGGSATDNNPSDIQGIAFIGWHVPSDSELNELFTYISTKEAYILNNESTYIAKAVASETGWATSSNNYTPGNNPSYNNATNLSMVAAGVNSYGSSNGFQIWSYIQTVTEESNDSSKVWHWLVSSGNATVNHYYSNKLGACAVRCVLDMSATEYINKNRSRLYLKNGSDAMVWSQLSEIAESGSYNDLLDKPTTPSAQVQSDWEQNDNSEVDFIKNKPTLGTAAALDVPASGNASTTQVVKGDDTRLSDSRNAADVYSWAKAATKPSYSASEVGAIPSTDKGANGGVAELDSNGKVPSSQLPSYVDDVLEYASQSAFPATGESGKIYIAQDTNKTYRWSGSAYVEISESLALGETSSTAYAGNKGKANADAIAALKDGTSIDSFGDVETALADKINKSSTVGLVKNDGTIDTNTYLTQHQDISGKADKVSNVTNGHLASLDSNGNLTDSTIAGSDVSDAVSKKHSHSNKSILDLIPSSLGTEGQAIVVNSTEDGLEFGTVASSATQVIFRVWS